MNFSLSVILVILALVAFVLAAIGWTYRKTDLIAVGLALWSLSFLISRLSHLSLGTIILLLAFLAFVAAAVSVVTMTSSNESANASIPPATTAVEISGSVMSRNAWNPLAPRSIAASSSEP